MKKATMPRIGTPLLSLPLIISALSNPVSAQELMLEEVIVTAQKREQNLQDVPVAVTAISGQILQDNGIKDVFDLQVNAPGLRVDQTQSATSSNFGIRGVFTSSQNFGLESSVGLYVDGVYRARQSSMINNLVDVESVQVLRGPQGTLFGRNTPVGAVLINSVAPDFENTGFFEATAGNFNLLNFSAAASVTAIEDVLAFRITGFSSDRDGYVDDVNLGDGTINDRNRWGVRLQALFTPTDELTIRVMGDRSMVDEACCGALSYRTNQLGANGQAGTDATLVDLGGTLFTGENFYDHKTALTQLPVSQNTDTGLSVQIDYDLNDTMTLTSISAYRAFDSLDEIDVDFSDADALIKINDAEQNSFSQELRLNWIEERFTFVGGLFYYTQELNNTSTLEIGEDTAAIAGVGAVGFPLPQAFFPPGSSATDFVEQEHDSWAVFGQSDIFFGDDFTLTVGLRYSDEQKEMRARYVEDGAGPGFAFFPPLAPRPADLPDVEIDEIDDDRVTGTLKFSWQATDTMLTYVSYGTGYKSGGTNTDRISPQFSKTFDAETSESLEIGMKAEFPEQGIRLNIAIHKTEVEDLQTIAFVGTGFLLANAGNADTYGSEIELTWQPAENTRVMAAYAYTIADFEDFENGPCWTGTPFLTGQADPGDNGTGACDRSGGRVAGNPEHFFTLNVRQGFNIADDIGAFVIGEYVYTGDIMTDTNNDPIKAQPSYSLVNFRAGLEFLDHDAELTIWGRNILDEEYLSTVFDVPAQTGRMAAYAREPGTYGITFRKNF